MKNFLPYGELVTDLLNCIIDGIKICYDVYQVNPDKLESSYDVLNNHYKRLLPKRIELPNDRYKYVKTSESFLHEYIINVKKREFNKHLIKGLPDSHHDEERHKIPEYPRLTKLTILSFKEAQLLSENSKNFRGICLPSPLNILYKYLTVPENTESSSFALATCRTFIYLILDLSTTKSIDNKKLIHIKDISESYSSFTKHILINSRWPDWPQSYFDTPFKNRIRGERSRINLAFGHFTSMLGMSHLWFRTTKNVEDFLNLKQSIDVKLSRPNFAFQISYLYNSLPQLGEIENLMLGIPVGIKGFETIFFGGLKKSSNNGLVVSISGKPGAGKTSLALSFAAVLSPLKTKCLYISLEEGINEIKNRLYTVIPDYLKKLSIYHEFSFSDVNHIGNEWFYFMKLSDDLVLSDFTDKVIRKIKQYLNINNEEESKGTKFITKPVCPSIIVIDNINKLVEASDDSANVFPQLEKFIHECRKLDTIVFIISGYDVPSRLKMDYLVDITIELNQDGTEKYDEKPIRLFNLQKTRHQLSRTGTHIFHMSGNKGFRISPQVPSQLDKNENIRKRLPTNNFVINTLNIVKSLKYKEVYAEKDTDIKKYIYYQKNVDIFPGSQILIHGHGSGGKAGFALKILLTPPIEKKLLNSVIENNSSIPYEEFLKINNDFSHEKYRRKILILSFLYPKEYYDELIFTSKSNIFDTLFQTYPYLSYPNIEYITFYPGFLTPEDLVNKITKKLDEAIYNGEPFTGILLDGMHNVFLQFKKLQQRDMLWPLLYNIFSRYYLTVVTTFTNFKIDNDNNNNNYLDYLLMQQGQTPFLHAMVRASDFYFTLEDNGNTEERKYIISQKVAIKQDEERKYTLEWDKFKSLIFECNTVK